MTPTLEWCRAALAWAWAHPAAAAALSAAAAFLAWRLWPRRRDYAAAWCPACQNECVMRRAGLFRQGYRCRACRTFWPGGSVRRRPVGKRSAR